jgi:TRAP-type C4-dicarboxylate transport system permease small subunit
VRSIIKELILSFLGGVLGATTWFHIQELIVPNIHEIDITLPSLIIYYAIPIQSIGTAYFFIELWLLKSLNKLHTNNK